jgi:riboflavin kinase
MMELEGEVTTGLGKGKIYMSKEVYQEIFDEKLGFRPFPGTLNLEVDEKERRDFEHFSEWRRARKIYENGNRLSDVDITPCKIGDVECALLRLEKTDHPMEIAEVIAPVELREKFNLEDGDKVTLRH